MSAALGIGSAAAFALALLAVILGVAGYLDRPAEYWFGWCAIANFLTAAQLAVSGSRVPAGIWLAFAAVCAWAWWHEHRKNRGKRRAADAIGEKSRRIRAALVRRMRESARPRPVLRPGRVPA